ncbi:MAG: NAD(P)/FAD-dependent oxidoreductase [Clostridiaceae bacterium]|jgi:predicted flavoprotein YhiN|nr:NAD(P)/FAD-dependent oxidoreductase [Clostridiaceae bacterium]
MEKYDVVIIGGGAGGLFAANVIAAGGNKSICVIEANARVGKKLSATGGGRCNLSNTGVMAGAYGNAAFAEYAVKTFDTDRIRKMFKDLGLLTKVEDGRVYPYSESAATVIDVLRGVFDENNGIVLKTGYRVINIQKSSLYEQNDTLKRKNGEDCQNAGLNAVANVPIKERNFHRNKGAEFDIRKASGGRYSNAKTVHDGKAGAESGCMVTVGIGQGANAKTVHDGKAGAESGYILTAAGDGQARVEIAADKVILATGSPAGGGLDSSQLYVTLGHTAYRFVPGLAPLVTERGLIKGLSGLRAYAEAEFEGERERGEIQFRDFGVSGIAIFNLSAKAARRGINSGVLTIDFMPEYDVKTVKTLILTPNLDIFGILRRPIAEAVLRSARAAQQLEKPNGEVCGGVPSVCGVHGDIRNNTNSDARSDAYGDTNSGVRGDIYDDICGDARGNVYGGVLEKNAQKTQAAALRADIEADAEAVARVIKGFKLTVTGGSDMSLAQTANGGLNVNEFDDKTMQSRICKGLYAVGECLDTDAPCGGFNLHWAFASAATAAFDIIGKTVGE